MEGRFSSSAGEACVPEASPASPSLVADIILVVAGSHLWGSRAGTDTGNQPRRRKGLLGQDSRNRPLSRVVTTHPASVNANGGLP